MVYFWWSDTAILSNLLHHSWHFWTQKSGERSLIAREKASMRGQLPYPQGPIWKTERVNPPHSKDDWQVLLAVTQKGKQTRTLVWQMYPNQWLSFDKSCLPQLQTLLWERTWEWCRLMTSSGFQCSSARLIKTGLCVLINSIPFEEEPLNSESNRTFSFLGIPSTS